MNIRLGSKTWRYVCADKYPEFVRCAFYLGYGLETIREIAINDFASVERQDVIETARLMGITEQDKIHYEPNVLP